MKSRKPTTSILVLSCCAAMASNSCDAQNLSGATNDISTGISLVWNAGGDQLPQVIVSIYTTNEHGFYGEKNAGMGQVQALSSKILSDKLLYFKASNLFCGPIELHDKNGVKQQLLKPAVSAPEAYPKSFSFKAAKENHPNPPTQTHLADHGDLARFQLGEYFRIQKPGEYHLTVWPKIYKRQSEDSDTCQLIELPPVTASFKWDGPKTSK